MRGRRRWLPVLGAGWVVAALVGPVGAATDPFESDARLQQPVRLEARHQELDEFLAQLTQTTGVSLQAEGEAADLRVTAFLSDLPLRQVLERLKTLLHLTWRRAGEGEQRAYMLFASESDRQAVAAARERDWEAFRSNIRRLVLAATRPDRLGPDPFDRAARGIVAFASPRAAARAVATLPEPLLDAALRSGNLRVPFHRLSPSQQEALREYQRTLHAERVQRHGQAGAKVIERDGRRFILQPPGEPEPLEEGGLELRVERRTGDGQRAQLEVTTFDRKGRRHGGLLLGIDPARSLPLDDRLEIPRHFDERRCALPEAPTLRLPELSSALAWEEALARFARENRVSLLSDAFDCDHEPGPIEPAKPGAPADEILDRLCVPYDYTWNASAPLLLFRRRDWFLERERQIPERLARRWRRLARERGAYPLAELARMTALNEGQRLKLWKYAGVDAFQAVMWTHRDLLRLYASLRPVQQALAHEEGLALDALDLAQQKLVPPVVEQARPGPLDLPRSFQRLQVRQPEGEPTATVTLYFRDGERRALSVNCRARPARDPWTTTNLPLPAY